MSNKSSSGKSSVNFGGGQLETSNKSSSGFNKNMKFSFDKPVNKVNAPKSPETVGDYRLLATGSGGRFLEVPQIIPIYDNTLTPNVPFSIPLAYPDTKKLNFRIPSGDNNIIITGWYAILVARVQAGDQWRLIALDPDTQHYMGRQPLVAGNPPAVGNYVPQFGFQAGNTIQYGWQLSDWIYGGYHHAHNHNDWRIFELPFEVPAGANGQLTIRRTTTDKWFKMYPDTELYLYVGLIGRRRIEIPPPFNMDSTDEPVTFKSASYDGISIANSGSVGSLGVTNVVNVDLTNRHPTELDQLIISGELDGLYTKISWVNGMISLDWVPAMLFQYNRSAGRLVCPMFVYAPTQIQFDFAQGVRQISTEDDEATIAIDLSGGIYGF